MSTMNNFEKKYFTKRSVLALLGACLYQCAFIGTLIHSNGIFMSAIREAEGVSMTMISANTSLRSIIGALSAAGLTSLFYHRDFRKIMALVVVLVVAGYLLLIVGTDNILWYLVPLLCCPVSSIGILAVPYTMRKWFPEHYGMTSGIALAFSGLGGAVFNPVSARLCEAFGWKMAIVIMSALSIIMAAAGLYLLFGLKGMPEEGRTRKQEARLEPSVRVPVPMKFGMVTVMVLTASVTVMVTYIAMQMQAVGFSLEVGAAVTSFVMIGNIGGKVIFGWLTDKLGIWKMSITASCMVAAGSAILGLSHGSVLMMDAAGMLFGFSYYCLSIALSRIVLTVYGTKTSSKYVGQHLAINSAVGSLMAFGAGPIFDMCGSFTPLFIGIAITCMLSAGTTAAMWFLAEKCPESAYVSAEV